MNHRVMKKDATRHVIADYRGLVGGIGDLFELTRRNSTRVVNALMTATYWEIGRRIVDFEQSGKTRATYGTSLLDRLSKDLTPRFGRGFSVDNLETMRLFYRAYPPEKISGTVSRKLPCASNSETLSWNFTLQELAKVFTLPWSHYTLLVKRSRSPEARIFYEAEALRGGWSVRQLDRQINSQFYERTALYLLKEAATNERDASSYNALNKGAILLLAAKLEAFSEQILEEFCFRINEKGLTCDRLPVRIRLNASRALLHSEFMANLDRFDEGRTIPSLMALSCLWHQGAKPADLAIDCKFTYGRHGEREFRRLFRRIGIEDIFESCKVPDDAESYDSPDSQQNTAVTSEVNALIGYRNYIIHNDGTPSVTHVQLQRYRKRLFLFAHAIDTFVAACAEAIT